MDSLVHRIVSTALEATVAGIALSGILMLIRRIQIALSARHDDKNEHFPVSTAR